MDPPDNRDQQDRLVWELRRRSAVDHDRVMNLVGSRDHKRIRKLHPTEVGEKGSAFMASYPIVKTTDALEPAHDLQEIFNQER